MATTKKPRTPSRAKAAEVRAATRARKRAERAEYRRFTRASRQRRLSATAGIAGIVVVAVLSIVLTTSPILSLKTIQVEGTERLDNAQIIEALQPYAGAPLAQISPSEVANSLADIALIQSVDTRLELPGTLVVEVVERDPIGAVAAGGGFDVVDRAAVVLYSQAQRPTEFPLIGIPADPDSDGFQAIGQALGVIPTEVLARIEQVSATSADTVAFTLKDSNHRVIWGSAEQSREKARVLPAALRAAGEGSVQVIDLSTPDTVVIRDAGIPLPTPGTLETEGDDAGSDEADAAVDNSADDTP